MSCAYGNFQEKYAGPSVYSRYFLEWYRWWDVRYPCKESIQQWLQMSFQTHCPLGGNPFFSEDLALSLYGYLYNTCSMISHTICGTQHSCVVSLTLVSNIWSAKQCQDPSSDPQRTQQITRSAFRISPQPDWQMDNFKSWYVGGGSEPQFQCWFVDRLNQRLNFVCGRGYVLTISRLYLSGCWNGRSPDTDISQSKWKWRSKSKFISTLFMVTFWLCSHGTGQIFNRFQEKLCV